MVKRVRWNKRAIVKLDSWVEYLEHEVSFQSASILVKNIRNKIEMLKQQPAIGRSVVEMKTIRFLNIDKNRQMFYRVQGSTIFITDFLMLDKIPKKDLICSILL